MPWGSYSQTMATVISDIYIYIYIYICICIYIYLISIYIYGGPSSRHYTSCNDQIMPGASDPWDMIQYECNVWSTQYRVPCGSSYER